MSSMPSHMPSGQRKHLYCKGLWEPGLLPLGGPPGLPPCQVSIVREPTADCQHLPMHAHLDMFNNCLFALLWLAHVWAAQSTIHVTGPAFGACVSNMLLATEKVSKI